MNTIAHLHRPGHLAATIAVAAFGVTPIVIRSDSMAPAINRGDLALARTHSAGDASVGDVVSLTTRSITGRSLWRNSSTWSGHCSFGWLCEMCAIAAGIFIARCSRFSVS